MNSDKSKILLDRKQLYDLVWTTPLRTLSKKYCISDNGLRKICRRMNIPLPQNGHWQKIKYGKRVLRKKLPKDFDGKDTVELRKRDSECQEDNSRVKVVRKKADEIAQDNKLDFKVPDQVSRYSSLIATARKYYGVKKRSRYGTGGTYPKRSEVLNIDVTQEHFGRACRILNTLIKLLMARKHDVKVDYFQTYASVFGEDIEFRIRERKTISERKGEYGQRIYESTGDLILVIGKYGRKEFRDSKERLEQKMALILAYFEIEGEKLKEQRITSEIRRKENEELERREKEIKKLQEEELTRFKGVFKEALRMHHVAILRNYIKIVEQQSKDSATSDNKRDWLKWVTSKINWYDPLTESEDLILNENHKETLFREFNSNLQPNSHDQYQRWGWNL